MTQHLKARFREFGPETLVTSEGGDFAFVENSFVERFENSALSLEEKELALAKRLIAPSECDWRVKSLALQAERKRDSRHRKIRYFMVIPTLRCNLACSYCQVSRAPIDARGFDWDERHLTAFEQFFSNNAAEGVKIEFQGGEISLRPDMIEAVEAIANKYCAKVELVACTNLFVINERFERLFSKDNFYISTSLDGGVDAMSKNRTKNDTEAQSNIANIKNVIDRYGIDKISFLPTITENNIDDPEGLVDLYASLGASGIFLRPVNFQGFARKQHFRSSSGFEDWIGFFERALEAIKKLNQHQYFEEVYIADLVRTVFLNKDTAFIDFRSPSDFLKDMAVIDFDGTIYPTDESRMLTRTRHVDLSVGSIFEGLDEAKIFQLNKSADKETHQDCLSCAYMPYCGVDMIDDLSRYKRIDLPKSQTWYCNKQMFFFDWIFDKVRRGDVEWLNIFARWAYRDANPTQNLDALIA